MTSPDELTDVGNAALFVTKHAHGLRHVASWGENKWLAWDGKRWTVDATGRAEHLAQKTVRDMFADAAEERRRAQEAFERAQMNGDLDLARLQKERMSDPTTRYAWALKSHDAARVGAMVRLARSARELAIAHTQLDADPMLFNVANGTLDLTTGRLRAHNPADLITKLAPIAYDPNAQCPTWDAFLSYAQAGNADVIGFMRRFVGYCLTGVIRDHVLLFLFGPAGTGKSTFFRVMHELLGDYAVRAPRSLLFMSRGERHPTELASLFGARFVSCNEIDEGAAFDEALVKDLTGGEDISARRMREDFWSFRPTHKLAIGGNHKPRVRNFDDAIRRRLRMTPWLVKPSTMDTRLIDKLRGELPGILAWAVRGCAEWQRDGLGEPVEVKEATDAYQGESDPFREFFELHVVFEPDARIPRVQLRNAYEDYVRENGATPVHARRFAEALRRHGVEGGGVRHAGRVMNGWKGVRLATDAEREKSGCRQFVGTNTPIIDTYAPAHTHEGERAVGAHEVPTAYAESWPEVAQ